jgi:HAD superfamily hydrolase (TIGR01509 family)
VTAAGDRELDAGRDDPRAIDLVIFDCDGVLVDSEHLAVRVEARLLAELGWPLTEEEVLHRFVGRSNADVLREIEAHLGRSVPDWTVRYEDALFARFEAELAAVDGVVGAIDELERRGLATCVASSGPHQKMRLTLGLTGLHERFDGRIYSSTQVANGKPAPDLFLFAAASMGVDPARCVVVEDSRPGVAAARAAGMRVFGYAGGLTPHAWLEGPGTLVFDDMAALPDLVRPPSPR